MDILRKPAVKSYTRAAFAVVLAAFLADGADLFSVSLDDLRTWLALGIGAAGAVGLKALDGNEPEFGRVNDSDGFEILPDDDEE